MCMAIELAAHMQKSADKSALICHLIYLQVRNHLGACRQSAASTMGAKLEQAMMNHIGVKEIAAGVGVMMRISTGPRAASKQTRY